MAPPQHWPPELNEDVTTEILLRISPDEPAHLFRASVVCKLWLRVTSDPAFLRRYRAFHRRAPLLGFFFDNLDSSGPFPGFVPTTAASLSPQTGHGDGCVRWVDDCRHGLVLLRDIGSRKFVVWDPFSNHCEELEAPSNFWYPFQHQYSAVVLCAETGCDHRSCCGGPFHVVCLGIDNSAYTNVHVHVYSSKSRSWCTPASAQLDSTLCFFNVRCAALIGDGIYCIVVVDDSSRILNYDLVKHRLSLMDMPFKFKNVPVLMANEDGSLGIARVLGSRLYLWSTRHYQWSTMANSKVVTGWVQRRVIKLEEILPVDIIFDQAYVIGFAEGVEVFFISTNAGAFTFEMKSGRVRKVGEPRNYHGVTPFISFFTPDHGCSKWTK